MKQTTVVDFSDLLFHAESLGYSWNEANDILVKDEVPPMYELKSREYSSSDFDANEEWSKDTIRIMKSFFEKNQLEEFTLVE